MAREKLTAKAAIEKVLRTSGKPMRVPEIIEKAVPLTALSGATPGQTIYSVLYSENNKPGGMFKRTTVGTFKLSTAKAAARTTGSKTKASSKKSASRKKAAA